MTASASGQITWSPPDGTSTSARVILEAYDALLKTDATNERALAESAAVRVAASPNE